MQTKSSNKFDEGFNRRMADMFKSQFGKEFMEWLDLTYFNQISHNRGDSHQTAFNEGGRDVVFDIKKRIEKYGRNQTTDAG